MLAMYPAPDPPAERTRLVPGLLECPRYLLAVQPLGGRHVEALQAPDPPVDTSPPNRTGDPGIRDKISGVNKQTALVVAAVAALALATGGAIGFIWQAPGQASTWADVRTWATFAVVLVGVPTALIQLNLQRLQLRSQQKVINDEADRNKRRDELLDGQLRELEQRAQVGERQQAEAVEFSWQPATPLAGTATAGPIEYIWMGVVRNESRRPIRDVVCRIQPHPSQGFDWGAQAVGELIDVGIASAASALTFQDPKLGDRVPLIRAGDRFGFKTSIPVADNAVARMKVRFTDDAGLHWEIDPDLHLAKLASRDW
jgi:hypothetical protein